MARRVAVLISGGGSNLQALIDAAARPGAGTAIALVISNRPDAYGSPTHSSMTLVGFFTNGLTSVTIDGVVRDVSDL